MPAGNYSRRAFLSALGVTGAAAATAGAIDLFSVAPAGAAIPGPQNYTAKYSSVDQHPAAPEWFQDAKFGIYFHWGAFSVPAYHSEWYPREMYIDKHNVNNHHREVFGEPVEWPYHNFIDGARDKAGRYYKFAPKLKANGGNFDPDEWAQLFVDAGAKFAGPVAEHHDGFSMWDSKANEWNSVAKGPKLDLLRLHADAIRKKGLKLVVAMHHAFNHTGFYDHVPRQSDASLRKLYGQLDAEVQNQLWYDKLKEVIDGYKPDIIWQDFNLNRIDETQRLNFLSYYYNQAVAWDKEVVATYKDGFDDRGEITDYERGGPGEIRTPYWLTDDAISSSSWSYTTGIGYYSLNEMLHSLIDRVSKGGNMLLNISPTADGTIPQSQRDLLHGIGNYLSRFGESIYTTRAWSAVGEGPTRMGGGAFTRPRAGTAEDIRFTRSKDNRVLYATVLGWPGESVNIATLTTSRLDLSGLKSVQLLGFDAGTYVDLPTRTQDADGLRIALPSSSPPFSAPAYVIKLTFTDPMPVLAADYHRITNVTNGLVLDSGGDVAAGSVMKQWAYNGSPNLQWQLISLGSGYHRLVNRTNGMVIDGTGATTNGSPAKQAAWSGATSQQWQIAHRGNGRYTITNRATNLVLDGGGAVASGSTVKQWKWDGSTNLLWTFTAI